MRAALFVAADGGFQRLSLLQRLPQFLAPTQGMKKLPSVRAAHDAEGFACVGEEAVARDDALTGLAKSGLVLIETTEP
jgi:hypothetical protein